MRVPDGLWYGGIVAWALLIGFSCFWPVQTPDSLDFDYSDKLGHVLLFGIAAFWLSLRLPWGSAVLIVVVFGVTVEGVQSLLPYRSAELLDALADALGALLGAASGLALRSDRVTVR